MLDPITVWIVAVGAFVVGAWLGMAVMAACAGQRIVEIEDVVAAKDRVIERMREEVEGG